MQRLSGGGGEEWLFNGYGDSFGHNENVLELYSGDDCTILWIYWKHWVVCFKKVNFMGCEFYLNKAVFRKIKAFPSCSQIMLSGLLWMSDSAEASSF